MRDLCKSKSLLKLDVEHKLSNVENNLSNDMDELVIQEGDFLDALQEYMEKIQSHSR